MINTNKNENLSDNERFELIKSGRIPEEEITEAELERLLDTLDNEEQGQVQLVPPAPVPAPVKKEVSTLEQAKRKIEAKRLEDARQAEARVKQRAELKTKQSLPTLAPVKEESLLSKVAKAIETPETIPEFDSEYYQKRLAEIAEAVTGKRFTGVLQQEFERINKVLTLRAIPPYSRNFQKFGKMEYKNEAQKGRYGIAEQKANLHWLWVHHRETILDLCTTAPGPIFEFFHGGEYSDDLADKIARLQGNIDYTKGFANFLSNAKKCELLGLPDYIQRELSVFHSEAVKKEKQREAAKKKRDIDKIAKQERDDAEKIRQNKIELANVRYRLSAYKKDNPLKNGLDADMEELLNVWLAIKQVGGNTSKLTAAKAAYENATNRTLHLSAFRRRIALLRRASIL